MGNACFQKKNYNICGVRIIEYEVHFFIELMRTCEQIKIEKINSLINHKN